MKNTYQLVVDWADSRGILSQSTAAAQMLKASEEHGEMATAVLENDLEEVADAIGDQLVVVTVQAAQLGYDPVGLFGDIDTSCQLPSDNCEIVLYRQALRVTALQGRVAQCIAKGRVASADMCVLVSELYQLAALYGIDVAATFRDVYEIINARRGKMRDGVWVKEADL